MTKLNRSTDPCPSIKSTNNTILFTCTIIFTLLSCLSNYSFAQTKAFPSVKGAGSNVTGGRGGIVVEVTNLNNSGSGSLRDALMMTVPRTIVFEVSGTIILNSRIELILENSNFTIAGQTAPEGGITISNNYLHIGGGQYRPSEACNNVIIRHIRFRNGRYTGVPDVAEHNGIITTGCDGLVIDHCSFSFCDDQAITMGGDYGDLKNITIQSCLFSENATAIIAGGNGLSVQGDMTFINNLFVDQGHRTPNIGGNLQYDIINNVFFNWESRLTTSTSNSPDINYIGNYLREGEYTSTGHTNKRQNGGYNTNTPQIYTANNYHSTYYTTPQLNDRKLWQPFTSTGSLPNNMFTSTMHPLLGNPTILSSIGTYNLVLSSVGADKYLNSDGSFGEYRDSFDALKIRNVEINISSDPFNKNWTLPILPNNNRANNYDSDNDGMPNLWETQNGLNPNNSSDRNIVQPDGYTNLEYFLNGMPLVINSVPGCSNEIISFPYSESFENTLGAWTQSPVDEIDWTLDANGTPSNGTGPSSASQGAYYAFVEASGNPTKQAQLNSPCFNLSGLSDANFSFKYHQYGSSDIGTIDLEVSDDNGTNWTSIWGSSGNKGNIWLTENVDLGAYVGGSVQLRFNRVIGNSYQADIAIDDVGLSGSASTGSNDCSEQITSFPYNESFENTLGAWTQSTSDDMDWSVDANGTPSSATGPSSASQGTYYAFVEASGNPTKQALLNSPCFDLSSLLDANFSFKYHQYGSSDIGKIDLEASDDNGANWTSIWNSSGNLGDTWLTANINLGAYVGGNVQLRFHRVIGSSYQADIAIDAVSLSEVVSTVNTDCSGGITSFPYTEGFENTLGAWTQSSADDMDWTVHANGSPSSGTGPSSASQGAYYAFVEASGNPTKQALLNSPCFDLSSLLDANFSFKYHQNGSSAMGTIDLEVSDDSGSNWTSIWISEGNLGNTWLTANIDLGAYVGGSIQLRFNRVIGNSYQADLAIDDVRLSEAGSTGSTGCSEGITSFPYSEGFENNLGAWTQSSADDMDWTVDASGTPSSSTGPSSASQGTYYAFVEASGNLTKQALLNSPCFDLSSMSDANFSFKYHQYGSSDIGTIDLEASDDSGANWSSIWNSSGNLGNTWLSANIDLGVYVGGSVQLRFNRVMGNSYQADIAIDDVSLSEVASTGNTGCSGGITSFPYTEGFENTLGAWTQSSVDDMDWTINANGTPSNGTGPSSASQNTYYVFVEASDNLTKQALLNSPCFDLSGLPSAQFSFNYHQFGSADMGAIDLEASDDNGVSWTSIWNSSGNLGNSWLTANINLAAYVGGSVQLRFNRVTGGTWQADIAIDNINISSGFSARETTTKTTATKATAIVLDDIKDITLYPNPVTGGLLNIKSTFTNISFEIYNMVGQLVSKGNVKNKAINVSNLNGALYQIRFSSEGETITKRFIKQ